MTKKKQVIITHEECGTEMETHGVTKSECMGWYTITYYCKECKVTVEVDEMGTEEIRRG